MTLRAPSRQRAMRAAWWACWARCALAAALAGAGGARELDPAACAARFDVQRDKIIRTEESREMGARYLSELDVGARAECLRLCCETDACDVFVFEEKSPGSCYLFNCGPPEDFRCKFTAHGNFSSGVLALSRRLAELQDRERLAHHERELASLSGGVLAPSRRLAELQDRERLAHHERELRRRAGAEPPPRRAAGPRAPRAPREGARQPEVRLPACHFSGGVLAPSRRLAELQDRERLAHHERELASLRSPPSSTASTPPTARSTAPPRPPPPREPPPPPALPTGRCHRNQFECRVGGECIAVYNACDGVPQCADASDEAPELGCPPPPEPVPPPTTTTPPTAQVSALCCQFECRVGGECIAVYNACDGVPQCADASDEAPELGCPPPPEPVPPPTTTPPPTAQVSALCCQFECRVGGECIAVYNACDGVPQCADASDEAPELGCPPPPEPVPPPTTTPPPTAQVSALCCQFECRVGGECIAVYNACDGMPQCADASDEAPELGCPPPPEPVPPPTTTTPPTAQVSALCCQFECRVGGECIAVYNACDGVPQCADASDEAPELGCPPPPEPVPPPTTTTPPTAQIQLQESVEEGSAAAEGAAPWPHRLVQAQTLRRYSAASASGAGGSHIFSHKGGLLQEGAFEPPPARPPWPPRAWAPPPPPAGEGADAERGWGYGRLDWPDVEPRRAWPVPPPRPDPELPLYLPSKTMPEMPMVYASQQHTLRDAPKKGFELSAGPAPPAAPPAAPPPAPPTPPRAAASEDKSAPLENTTKKKALKDNAAEPGAAPAAAAGPGAAPAAAAGPGAASAAAAREAQRWPDEHDGLSEHPPAAVLLLVLGTLMTASLGALLACRARAARRRRRAHPRLALDADYLVNGMYL
ncbi:ras-associated and pleckstrin homology domains-containing protein 1 [Maniola hyperantus]|uniref:ras-associated and pleckstrin homology domains-containing protein 1 n=1 Tax=Aphantopus hyperantus TaxID=2795564 RepID=UPI003747F2F0